jgi:hypothetical protein
VETGAATASGCRVLVSRCQRKRGGSKDRCIKLRSGELNALDLSQGWYVRKNGFTIDNGPYPWADLVRWARSGDLVAGDLVWHPAWTEWRAVGAVPELISQLPAQSFIAAGSQRATQAQPQPVTVVPSPPRSRLSRRPSRRTPPRPARAAGASSSPRPSSPRSFSSAEAASWPGVH